MNLTSILEKLISFPTVTGRQEETLKALTWIESSIARSPLRVKLLESGGYFSLLVTTKRTKTPKIWLAAHLDVVPAAPSAFRPIRKGGKLYGRGVFDMKFAIACYIQLFRELGVRAKELDVGMMITTDEEVGGHHGVNFLVNKRFLPDICFLPDGGFNWSIEKEAKQAWWFEIESQGKSAPGSRPWAGKNAIVALVNFLGDLEKEFPSEPCEDASHRHNTVNVGWIEGGKVVNQIPSLAHARIDVRCLPNVTRAQLMKTLTKVSRKYLGIKVRQINYVASHRNSVEKVSEISLFRQLAREMYGVKMPYSISHGASDARFFTKKKVPVLLTTPRGGGHHTDREWIDLKDLERYYQVMKRWVIEVGR